MTQYPLTDVKIRKMKPDVAKRFEVWDAKLPGFGVRVAPTGTKSFVLLYRQNGRARRAKRWGAIQPCLLVKHG